MNTVAQTANGRTIEITAVCFPENDVVLTTADGQRVSLLNIAQIVTDYHDLAWHLAQLHAYRSGRHDGWRDQRCNPYQAYSDSFFSYSAGWLRGASDKAGGSLSPCVARSDAAALQRDPSYVGDAPQFVSGF